MLCSFYKDKDLMFLKRTLNLNRIRTEALPIDDFKNKPTE